MTLPSLALSRTRLVLNLARDYVRFGFDGHGPLPDDAPDPDDVRVFCTFIGYSRSGHSLVAACLDAHRHAVIAHEQKTFLYVTFGFDRRRLYRLLAYNAAHIGHTRGHSGRRSGGYAYDVPGQWQGRSDGVRVIGDKHGEDATWRLLERPWLLDRLRRIVGVPVRLVHVVRNPFDNIATMARRSAGTHPLDLAAAVRRYEQLADANAAILSRAGTSAITVRHEALVAEAEETLARLCGFLDLEPDGAYLSACSSIVFDRPRRTADLVPWAAGLRRDVERLIERTPFLEGYAFPEGDAGRAGA